MTINRLKFIIIAIFLGLLSYFSIYFLSQPFLGLIITMAGIGFFGIIIGNKFLPKWSFGEQILWGSLAAWSIIGVTLTIFYYLWNLNALALWLSWLPLIIIALVILPVKIKFEPLPKAKKSEIIKFIIFGILIAALFIILASILWSVGTLESIRSPWTVIPNEFLFLSLILVFSIFSWCAYTRWKIPTWLILGSVTFLFLSVTLFIYKIGYGFDPFIHQATERYLAEHGTITPKPFYYIGQYSLVVFCHYFTHLGINLIDKMLLPAVAAAFLPAAIYSGMHRGFHISKNLSYIGALTFFIIPFSSIINTTPQGLANIFALLIIFLSLGYIKTNEPPLIFLILLSLMTLAIHPLTGIPITIFILLLILLKIKNKTAKIISIAAASIFGAIALPAIFLANAYISGAPTKFTSSILENYNIIFEKISSIAIYAETHYSSLIDFVYFYGSNIALLVTVIGIASLIVVIIKINKPLIIFGIAFLILLVNFFLLQNAVEFSFLIAYEQGAYASRVFELALFFLYPFFIYAILRLIKYTWQSTWLWRTVLFLFLSGLIVASLYLSYPRHDAVSISKGINVSGTDIAAVQWIERNAPDDEFIVLANQTVSAAALHEFGFKKYYDDKFYYPIPTGGELYDYYLKMSYESPSKFTMTEAMDTVGVDYGYLIINDYWWNSEKIIEDAKLQTLEWHKIDDGKIYIFKYTQ